jgi:hypothetical protein
MLELYDQSARPPTHPTASERLTFLRAAHTASEFSDLPDEALEWEQLFVQNAAPAVARAQINAKVVTRNIEQYLATGQEPMPLSGKILADPLGDLMELSRSGSMRLLLRKLRPLVPGPATTRAESLAEKYLPRKDPAFAPFWEALKDGAGDWV